MIRRSLFPLLVVAALFAAGQASADATPRHHGPTVTLTSCHVDPSGVRICTQRVVPVRWTHPGDAFVSFGTCKRPDPSITVHRSGGHVDYALSQVDADVWQLTAHTRTAQYRLRPVDGWQRVTRRTFRAMLNVSGAGASCAPHPDPQPYEPGQ